MSQVQSPICCAVSTHEAGESLVATLQSIYNQSDFFRIKEVLVFVDGKFLSRDLKDKIKHPKLRIIQSHTWKGQSAGLKAIFKKAHSDLLVLTNDDVILDKKAVKTLFTAWRAQKPDLLSGKAIPLPGNYFLGKVLALGYELNFAIVASQQGDSYLSCNGRLIALSKKMYKRVNIPENLLNNDAYLYLTAQLNNYKYHHSSLAKAFFHSPQSLQEHLHQTWRFQNSQSENQYYFQKDLARHYAISKKAILKAFLSVFPKHPVLMLWYAALHLYTRLLPHPPVIKTSGIWDTDKTTKRVSLVD
jgi:hypothetical protein